MSAFFILMFMVSGGLLGLGIAEYLNKKDKKESKGYIDWDTPKEIWEKDINDFRYYKK